MPDIYDQELDGIEAAEAEATKEAEATPKQSEAEPKKAEAKKETMPEDKGVRLSQEEYESFKRSQQREELNSLEAKFKKRYPDFNMEKVVDKVVELDEKEPGLGQRYFNDVGLENIYLTHFKDKAVESEDEFDIGRGVNGGSTKAEMIGKINKGEASLSDKQAFYAKYF